MQQKTVEVSSDVHITYRVLGQGPAVILLHGFCQWSGMWLDNGVAAFLSEEYTVILPDRRGHGLSSRPLDAGRYGMHMIDDVFSVLDAEGQSTAHLVGFSQGSEVAWRAAIARPERACSLVLISSGWPGPKPDDALNVYAEMITWLPEAIAANEPWLTPDPELGAFRAIVESMPEILTVPESAFAKLKMPVFGLVGDNDPERGTIERLDGMLPNYRFRILAGTDHPGSSQHPNLPKIIHGALSGAEAERKT